MKAFSSIALALALVGVTASAAEAQRPRPANQTKKFQSNKTIGLGLELGSPTGLTGKYFLTEGGSQALDFGIGAESYYFHGDYGLNIYADYLWHPVSLVSADAFELPLYFGIGGRFWDVNGGPNQDGYALGVRVPLGVSFDFNEVPLDVFIQATFVLDFFIDYDPHTIFPDLDFSVGVRYWFK